MLFSRKRSSSEAAVINLLKQLKVNFNAQDVIDELEKHPDYPSLLAVSDVLNWFKIETGAYQVSADELTEVPCPFIAHIHNDDFVIVNKITDDIADLSDEKRTRYSLKLDDLKKKYKGVVLTSEVLPNEIPTNVQSWPDRLSPYKVPGAIAILGLSFISFFSYSPILLHVHWQILLLALLKTIGLIASALLLVQSIDKNNPLVQTLCGGSKKANCNSILSSKAATVFKGLTWSEVGFFYFAGTWIALSFISNTLAVLQVLALLNIISLPYTIYSLNYQARIAKQWCVLCCTVQVLLWLEFIPLVGYIGLPGSFLLQVVPMIFICLLLPSHFGSC